MERWQPNRGVDTPTVFVGPERGVSVTCQLLENFAAEIILGVIPAPGSTRHPQIENINGLRASISVFHEGGVCGPLGRGKSTYCCLLYTSDAADE